MFNRYLYQRLQTETNQKQKIIQLHQQLTNKRKSLIQTSVNNYKTKVKNFLVDLAARPIQLGDYVPPLHEIIRKTSTKNILGSPNMHINGFKTDKQRTQQIQNKNNFFDHTPPRISFKNHFFRDRSPKNQIQPHMQFRKSSSVNLLKKAELTERKTKELKSTKSQSLKNIKFPSISSVSTSNPERKTHFKALEQMGNGIGSMSMSQNERMGLQNRLMIVTNNKQVHLQNTAVSLLIKSNYFRNKNQFSSKKQLKT